MEMPDFATFPLAQPLAFSPGGSNPSNALGTSHLCSCGDGCQCIGCAAHPYNEATQNYVRSAWNTAAEDTRVPNGSVEGSNTNGVSILAAPAQHVTDGEASPPAPQTPSDAASGVSEEQTLSANDFFFVTYPFGGDTTCFGETASCPCGDDCQCIGCAIHGDNGDRALIDAL